MQVAAGIGVDAIAGTIASQDGAGAPSSFGATVEALAVRGDPPSTAAPSAPVVEVSANRVSRGTELGDRVLGELEALHQRGASMAAKAGSHPVKVGMDEPRVETAGSLPGPAQAFPSVGPSKAGPGDAAGQAFERAKVGLLEEFHHAQMTSVIMRAVSSLPGSANKLLSG